MVVQRVVIEFLAHIDDVSDACGHELIDVSFGGNFAADDQPLGHKIERYRHTDSPERHSLTSTAFEFPFARKRSISY